MRIKLLATLEVDESLRKKFRSGELPKEWKSRYSDIFDDDDLRLALSQPEYHFYEWVAAIHLYEKMGYLSLLEQYEFAHSHKLPILQKINSDNLQKALEY